MPLRLSLEEAPKHNTQKAIVLGGHEWSLSNESEGGNVQEATREIGTSDLIVDKWTVGLFLHD